MPCTITAFIPMTFVCKWHTGCEIEVFQPANNSAYVGKCIKCQQEQDMLQNNQSATIQKLRNELEESQKKITKTKHNLKKGGKK